MALALYILDHLADDSAEATTSTTAIKMTAHGLETGDFIVNTSRRSAYGDPCSRKVTKTSADVVTVIGSAITGQTSGDDIKKFKFTDHTSILRANSLNITKSADHRDSAEFVILTDSNYIPQEGQYVKITNTTTVFGGYIKEIRINAAQPGTSSTTKIEVRCMCSGYSDIPSRRTISIDTSGTSEEIVKAMVDDYLYQEGIEYDDADIYPGYTWDEYPLEGRNTCISIIDVINDMANASGYQWWIDDNMHLHFIQETATDDAAGDLVDGGAFTDYSNLTLESSIMDYINKAFVKGGADEISGDTVVVYAQYYSGIQDRQDICGNSGVFGGIVEDSNITTADSYTAESGTNTTNITITGHPFSVNDVLYNATRNARIIVTADVNADNITVSPAVTGQTTGDEIRYYTDALVVANNTLKKQGRALPKTIEFETSTLTFATGTKMNVNLDIFGAFSSNSYWLIEEVSIFDVDGKNLRSRVKATLRDNTSFSTQASPNARDYFQAAFSGGGGGGSGSSSGGGNQVTVSATQPGNPRGGVNPTIWIKPYTTTTATGNYAVLANDEMIVCNSASALTITLPVATGSGREIPIKNINSGVATVDGDGSDTIDGSTTIALYQWESAVVKDYAANKWIII